MSASISAVAAKRLIRSGVDESQILDTPAKVKKALGDAWHAYQELGDRGESVNRAVIYDRARAAGKSHLEASYEARDLLDFTMSGKWAAVRLLTQTVPFLNARIQGLYRLGRGAKANPHRFSAVTGAVALASVALYLAQRDDEDYRALASALQEQLDRAVTNAFSHSFLAAALLALVALVPILLGRREAGG